MGAGVCSLAVPVGEAVVRMPFPLVLQVSLNDSHNQMVVHWAGEKSNVIVALARDSLSLLGPKNSDVSNATWHCPGVPALLPCQVQCQWLLSCSLPFSGKERPKSLELGAKKPSFNIFRATPWVRAPRGWLRPSLRLPPFLVC